MGRFYASVLDYLIQNLELVFKYRIYRKIAQIQDNIGSFLKYRRYRKYRTSAKPGINTEEPWKVPEDFYSLI
jgi:hypothetical protein